MDELIREKARQMIELALKLEVEEYLNRLKEEKVERRKALVVRNRKDRLSVLVVVGVTAEGRKELIAVELRLLLKSFTTKIE